MEFGLWRFLGWLEGKEGDGRVGVKSRKIGRLLKREEEREFGLRKRKKRRRERMGVSGFTAPATFFLYILRATGVSEKTSTWERKRPEEARCFPLVSPSRARGAGEGGFVSPTRFQI